MPFSGDGVPIIGSINEENLYIISGMASGGMMQGPGAAKLLVDMISGDLESKKKLQPADPKRFFK
jgi:glycine/D-amino acid oxidase-like deaminating enzyme